MARDRHFDEHEAQDHKTDTKRPVRRQEFLRPARLHPSNGDLRSTHGAIPARRGRAQRLSGARRSLFPSSFLCLPTSDFRLPISVLLFNPLQIPVINKQPSSQSLSTKKALTELHADARQGRHSRDFQPGSGRRRRPAESPSSTDSSSTGPAPADPSMADDWLGFVDIDPVLAEMGEEFSRRTIGRRNGRRR